MTVGVSTFRLRTASRPGRRHWHIHAVAIVHVAETNTYVEELIIAGATLAQPAHRSLRGGNWQSRCNLSDR